MSNLTAAVVFVFTFMLFFVESTMVIESPNSAKESYTSEFITFGQQQRLSWPPASGYAYVLNSNGTLF